MTSRFPYAANEVHRLELSDLSLAVVEGAIPDALSGHLFVVAPVGNFGDEDDEPRRNTLLNGDGMIYRVDFDPVSRSARVMSRLVQPACFHADKATREPRWSYLGFKNLGLARMSLLLCARNFGNTALVPMPAKPAKKDSTRLLVTYDVGRPLEIDPVTLKTITPVGRNDEWMGEFGDKFLNQPFKLVLTTAHPVWDMKAGHLFTVNYARSGPSMLTGGKELLALLLIQLSRIYRETLGRLTEPLFDKIASGISPALNPLLHALESDPRLLASTQRSVSKLASGFGHLAQWMGLFEDSCLRVARWDGEGGLECWDVVLANGEPVRIQNSMHQIAVTRNYVILADTGFKVALNQLYCRVFSAPAFDRLLRLLLSRRALSDLPLYIIRRADLRSTNTGACRQGTVTAMPVRLPFGAVHFLADYDDPGGQITLHAGHGSAVDIAEWVRAYDTSPWTEQPVEEWLSGMVTSATDVARLGRYVIDGKTGRVQEQQIISDSGAMWSLALYTAPGFPAWGELPDRNERLYWFRTARAVDLRCPPAQQRSCGPPRGPAAQARLHAAHRLDARNSELNVELLRASETRLRDGGTQRLSPEEGLRGGDRSIVFQGAARCFGCAWRGDAGPMIRPLGG
ncbi:carotenoid oxygenase family protein [Sorangium sp. So ce429]